MAKDINVDLTNRVLTPVGEVFQAIVDPDNLKYFASNANAPLRSRLWSRTS